MVWHLKTRYHILHHYHLTATFISHFFICIANQVLISPIRPPPHGPPTLYYMLDTPVPSGFNTYLKVHTHTETMATIQSTQLLFLPQHVLQIEHINNSGPSRATHSFITFNMFMICILSNYHLQKKQFLIKHDKLQILWNSQITAALTFIISKS